MNLQLIMNDEQKRNLVKIIEESETWQRIPTNVEGVNIVKAPENNNKQNVFVEILPVSDGIVIKRKGIYIKNSEELKAFKNVMMNPKVEELTDIISSYYNIRKVPKIEI